MTSHAQLHAIFELMVASQYGKVAWAFLVDDKPANDNVADEKGESAAGE